jgi:hypothetical protein
MDRDYIINIAREVGATRDHPELLPAFWTLETTELERFTTIIAAKEREAVLQAIEAVYTLEEDRNSMFSDGYKYALDQIETLIKARGQR